jgi:putative membrane protein
VAAERDGPDTGGTPWWKAGEEPDYRATLANERTFLAWSRTAFSLLAGSLAVIQLVTVVPRPVRMAFACLLVLMAVGALVMGYLLWRDRQRRMRMRRSLGHNHALAVFAGAFLVLSGIVATMIAMAPTD